jgi:hypothetical protein
MTPRTAMKKIAAACVEVRKHNLSELSLPFDVTRRELQTINRIVDLKIVDARAGKTHKGSFHLKDEDLNLWKLKADVRALERAFLQVQTTAQLIHKP